MRDRSNFSPAAICLTLAILMTGFGEVPAQSPGRSEDITESVRSALRLRLGYPPLPYAGEPEQEGARNSGAPPAPARVLTLEELIRAIDLYHPKLRGADATRRIASAKRLEKSLPATTTCASTRSSIQRLSAASPPARIWPTSGLNF
jgi:hypothetical protein